MVHNETHLPDGFRVTELGPLPEAWRVVRLGEVARVRYGKAKPRTNGTVPVVGSGGIYAWTARPLVNFPTLIIGRKGTAGQVWLAEGPCWPSDTTFYLEWKRLVDVRFLHGYFSLNPLSGEHAKTTLPSLQRPDLEKYPIPLPPLPEQRAIAHVLRTVQRAKEATERVIAALRELKKSLMRHLFTYGPVPVDAADQVALQDTPIGPIPAHWSVVRLGEVANIGNGATPRRTNPSYWDNGTIPWLTSAKVHEVIIRQADEYVTERALRECHLPLVPKGSIVVAITGQGKTLGNAALVTFDTTINQHLAYATIRREDIVPEFVLGYLRYRYQDLRRTSRAGGSTKGALTCGFLKRYFLPLPPLDEQREIARILQALDRKIEAEENRKRALEALFKSLLQHLMTARVRVKNLEAHTSEGESRL